MQSLFALKISQVFYLQDKHNASIYQNVLNTAVAIFSTKVEKVFHFAHHLSEKYSVPSQHKKNELCKYQIY